MPTLGRIAKDVRALGTSAPLRAAYEASKRFNGHSLLFREVKGGYRSAPVEFGTRIPESEQARARCLADAATILAEGTRVFAGRASTGASASWGMDPLTERCWPEDIPWWKIDIRTDSRLSDVKFVWEAARHRDLVVLARAATLEPEGPWLEKLEEMLTRWCRECPPERGVNWYSSLELALRAIAWNQMLALTGNRISTGLRAQLDDHLVASARHIMVELPYTMTSMKNNHLLGDGLGLVVLGQMFPTHPSSHRWRSIGDRLMLKQLHRHMRPDGSMIEDSLSYHRFVLEMFIVRDLLGDAPRPIRTAMRAAAEHLSVLGIFDGKVPQYGDWDEGRVLADSAAAGGATGTAHLALLLSGERSRPAEAWCKYDELAWYAARSDLDGTEQPRRSTWSSGQFAGASHGPWRVWLKQSLTQSHQHADLTSVWISKNDEWVMEDPGTGTYNGPLEVRDGFRTSAAHPVWRPSNTDLLGPHRAFRWQRPTVPCGGGSLDLHGLSVLCSWHDGFAETGRFVRVVLVDHNGVTIADRLPANASRWTMTVPHGSIAATELTGLGDAEIVCGSEHPFVGWHSPTYGSWEPSDWSIATTDGGWFVWGAGSIHGKTNTTESHVELGGVQLDIDDCGDVSVTVAGTRHHLETQRA